MLPKPSPYLYGRELLGYLKGLGASEEAQSLFGVIWDEIVIRNSKVLDISYMGLALYLCMLEEVQTRQFVKNLRELGIMIDQKVPEPSDQSIRHYYLHHLPFNIYELLNLGLIALGYRVEEHGRVVNEVLQRFAMRTRLNYATITPPDNLSVFKIPRETDVEGWKDELKGYARCIEKVRTGRIDYMCEWRATRSVLRYTANWDQFPQTRMVYRELISKLRSRFSLLRYYFHTRIIHRW